MSNESKKEPKVAVTVLVTPTTIGKAEIAAGTKLRIAKTKAETLASLNPPRVSIDGI